MEGIRYPKLACRLIGRRRRPRRPLNRVLGYNQVIYWRNVVTKEEEKKKTRATKYLDRYNQIIYWPNFMTGPGGGGGGGGGEEEEEEEEEEGEGEGEERNVFIVDYSSGRWRIAVPEHARRYTASH
jgi:hypothetical protein